MLDFYIFTLYQHLSNFFLLYTTKIIYGYLNSYMIAVMFYYDIKNLNFLTSEMFIVTMKDVSVNQIIDNVLNEIQNTSHLNNEELPGL